MGVILGGMGGGFGGGGGGMRGGGAQTYLMGLRWIVRRSGWFVERCSYDGIDNGV